MSKDGQESGAGLHYRETDSHYIDRLGVISYKDKSTTMQLLQDRPYDSFNFKRSNNENNFLAQGYQQATRLNAREKQETESFKEKYAHFHNPDSFSRPINLH